MLSFCLKTNHHLTVTLVSWINNKDCIQKDISLWSWTNPFYVASQAVFGLYLKVSSTGKRSFGVDPMQLNKTYTGGALASVGILILDPPPGRCQNP